MAAKGDAAAASDDEDEDSEDDMELDDEDMDGELVEALRPVLRGDKAKLKAAIAVAPATEAPAPEAPAEAPKEGETPAEDAPKDDLEEELNPIVDLSDFFIKPDHFEGIHVLDDALEKVEGAPNFRNIPGFPVYGTAQPTVKGMEEIVKKIKGAIKHAWDGYRRRAFGRDSVAPISGRPVNSGFDMAVTLVDSLDTLWLVGLRDEFRQARDDAAGTAGRQHRVLRRRQRLLRAWPSRPTMRAVRRSSVLQAL